MAVRLLPVRIVWVIGLIVLAVVTFTTRTLVLQWGARLEADRHANVQRLPERSRTLISAIRRFESEIGRPPSGLQELVPHYLAAIPNTGIAGFPDYIYKVFGLDDKCPVIWYDLGLPEPDSPAISDYRHDPEFGPPDHVLLELTFHGDGRRRLIWVDGLPGLPGTRDFDSEKWRANRGSRMQMARSLVLQFEEKIWTKDEALRLLGAPDGNGFVHDTPWELSVCLQGDNWTKDRMIYRPTKKYWSAPGRVFPIDEWLYIRGD